MTWSRAVIHSAVSSGSISGSWSLKASNARMAPCPWRRLVPTRLRRMVARRSEDATEPRGGGCGQTSRGGPAGCAAHPRSIAARYLGPEGARAYVDAVVEEAVLVRLEPQSVRAWDFSDVLPAP